MVNTPPIADAFRTTRALRLSGVDYAKGDAVPAEVVAKLPRAAALLSRRWIVPDPDTNLGRTPSHRPQPTAMPAGTRGRHLGRNARLQR